MMLLMMSIASERELPSNLTRPGSWPSQRVYHRSGGLSWPTPPSEIASESSASSGPGTSPPIRYSARSGQRLFCGQQVSYNAYG
jgi:hypothetical protein